MVLEYFENKYGKEYFEVDESGKHELLSRCHREINDNLF
jgi:hypothetical protein